jgi:hypothetical protein
MSAFEIPPSGPHGSNPDDLPDDCLARVMAGLSQDCQEAGAALLRGDLAHALARTRVIHHVARLTGFADIDDPAEGLEHAIREASEGRPTGVGLAFDRLSRARDDRLELG